jgi:hypothetical protein
VKRNSFLHNGGPEGEAINIQLGVTGDFAYNIVWSSATNCMKIYTDNIVKFPQTVLNIYNNTYYNTGHRRLQKPGNAILLDRFARAKIFNNIFVNCKQSLRITRQADIDNTTYGNNLFFADCQDQTIENNVISKFYPASDWGVTGPSDLFGIDPQFVFLDRDVNNEQNISDVHLKPSSPCKGAGNAFFNTDIGAYTSDGQGNLH